MIGQVSTKTEEEDLQKNTLENFRPSGKNDLESFTGSGKNDLESFTRPRSRKGDGGEGDGWRLVAGRWRPKGCDRRNRDVEVTGGRFEVLNICPVETEMAGHDVEASICGVRAEITVDSAADESVCPRQWAAHFGTGPKERDLKLVNASGGPIAHYGSRKVAFQPDDMAGRVLGVGFEVTDVKKPLMSVKRICEKGNLVQFGPDESFIQNLESGEKLMMHKRGNTYVLR